MECSAEAAHWMNNQLEFLASFLSFFSRLVHYEALVRLYGSSHNSVIQN